MLMLVAFAVDQSRPLSPTCTDGMSYVQTNEASWDTGRFYTWVHPAYTVDDVAIGAKAKLSTFGSRVMRRVHHASTSTIMWQTDDGLSVSAPSQQHGNITCVAAVSLPTPSLLPPQPSPSTSSRGRALSHKTCWTQNPLPGVTASLCQLYCDQSGTGHSNCPGSYSSGPNMGL